jgi:hypothetical protein
MKSGQVLDSSIPLLSLPLRIEGGGEGYISAGSLKKMPFRSVFCAFSLCLVPLSSASTPSGFVTTSGTSFTVDGVPFTYIGTNTYYLIYEDQYMLDDVFARASRNNFTVLRTWAWLDIGYPNGTGRWGRQRSRGVLSASA